MVFGTAVVDLIKEEKLNNIEVKQYGYPDEFIKHGSVQEIEKIYGLDKDTIAKEIMESIDKEVLV